MLSKVGGGHTPFINYVDFWTVNGFLRNLFFNGYHPFFPWFSFFLIGMIIGRLDLHNKRIRDRLLLLGITFTILIELFIKGAHALLYSTHWQRSCYIFCLIQDPFYQIYYIFYLLQDPLLLY
ncbi:heparan-alpha-glucosaminide N-acetyltransferase domain-containing protein [Bacillus toyonensis]